MAFLAIPPNSALKRTGLP